VSLLIVGDGTLRRALADEAVSLGIADRVHFVGMVSHNDKVKFLHMMDIFVLPSTHITEAFGITQIEAQICSRPLVSTNLPTGTSDINVDGATGLVVPPGDIAALAAAIQTLVKSKELRETYGARGRVRALELFSEHSYIDKLRAEVALALLSSAQPSPAPAAGRVTGQGGSRKHAGLVPLHTPHSPRRP
jgi:glycosyltransferase involved in cell wall biosynthesis